MSLRLPNETTQNRLRRKSLMPSPSLAPGKGKYSWRDIKNAVAVGEAVGKSDLYGLYNSVEFTVEWEFEDDKWTITAQYDSSDSERDYEAEDTLRHHAYELAKHAKVSVLDADGNELPECDLDGRELPGAAEKGHVKRGKTGRARSAR
jgi:hypothetical protein